MRRVPTDPAGFAAWFEGREETGPGQGGELFPWLAERAIVPDLCWSLHQEMAGEAGFDDLVALSQLKLAARPKLEMARRGFDGGARRHYALHATLDVRHSQTWIREVLMPLVESDERVAPLLAEGAPMRLRAGARCFERYRVELMPSETPVWRRVGTR